MNLASLRKEFLEELTGNILNYWVREVYDPERKIFFGRISNEGYKFPEAPISAVFTTRILWTFSAAWRLIPAGAYKQMADEAFRILKDMFWDADNGGIYWNVLPDGTVSDSKKQFYAEAFFIYAMSEYYLAFGNEEARDLALEVFGYIEKYAFDEEYGGYIEARTAGWKPVGDMRLSEKELNVQKTMNTHLHILEAYTSLYRIWKTEELKKQLRHLIRLFLDRIVDVQTCHFRLFFDADWTVRSDIDSFGHDIEGSWLLCEAAEVLGDGSLLEEVERVALKMAAVTAVEGTGKEGGIFYEKRGSSIEEQYDWWPQAEAVIGFFNAWQLSGNQKFFEHAVESWVFIKRYIVDDRNGEWFWGVSKELRPLDHDKINEWKAPYHNGRMCMEMIRRIEKYT